MNTSEFFACMVLLGALAFAATLGIVEPPEWPDPALVAQRAEVQQLSRIADALERGAEALEHLAGMREAEVDALSEVVREHHKRMVLYEMDLLGVD